jgi:hypothetical protein
MYVWPLRELPFDDVEKPEIRKVLLRLLLHNVDLLHSAFVIG